MNTFSSLVPIHHWRCGYMLHRSLRKTTACLALLLSIVVYDSMASEQVLAPVVTDLQLTWNPNGVAWEASLTYTALPIPSSLVLDLSARPYWTPTGHKHYANEISPPTVSNSGLPTLYASFSLADNANQRLEKINQLMFNTPTPTQGQTMVAKLYHIGRGFDPASPECLGGLLSEAAGNLWEQAIGWPYSCSYTPPPNQVCEVKVPETTKDLGTVAPGDIKEVAFGLQIRCSVDGGVTFLSSKDNTSGTGGAELLKTKVDNRDLPTRIVVSGGTLKQSQLQLSIKYSGAGYAVTAIALTWSPS